MDNKPQGEGRLEEKLMLLGEHKTPEDHGLGLLGRLVDYHAYLPFHVPRIPHSEGVVFWDNWLPHVPQEDPEVPSEPAKLSMASSIASLSEAMRPNLFIRVGILVLLFLLVFGPTLSYSSVGALYTQLKADLGYTDAQLGFLFSAYALPNIVAVFFAGVMVDSLGVNVCCIIFAGLYFLGNIIALGETYAFLLVGRITYGLGTECISVVQDAFIARWYSHDPQVTLSLALAVCMLSFRLSSFISMVSVAEIYDELGLFMVLVITAILVAVSFSSAIVLIFANRKYDSYLQPTTAQDFKWLSILDLPWLFWLLVIATFGTYGAVLPFISFSGEFLQQKWALDYVQASRVASYLYLTAAVVMVPAGFAIDRYAHRLSLTVVSCSLPIIAYSLLLWSSTTPILGCVILGLVHGLLPAAVFPSVALIVPHQVVGSAYGIITCAVNAALFVSPFALGLIADYIPGADSTSSPPSVSGSGVTAISEARILLLMAFALLGCCGAVGAWVVDYLSGSTLERTCVLKLGSKVSEKLVRESQNLYQSMRKSTTL